MTSVLMYAIMGLVCQFKAPGAGFRNLKFDLFSKYIYTDKASNSNFRLAWDFAKINTLYLVPLTKESWFPKEQSLILTHSSPRTDP